MSAPGTMTGDILASAPAAVIIGNFVGVGSGPVWYEADEPPGPEVRAGENVWFRLVVTNMGSIAARDIVLTDSMHPVLPCPVPDELAPGASFECNLDVQAAVLGQQESLAEVTAQCGTEVCEDANYAYYMGVPPFVPTVLSILPPVVILRSGESVAFQAVALDAAGGTMDITDRTIFAIDPQAGGSWSGNVYTGGALGTWTVSARHGDLDATTTLRTVKYKVHVPLVCKNR